jgi:hypothetical protein
MRRAAHTTGVAAARKRSASLKIHATRPEQRLHARKAALPENSARRKNTPERQITSARQNSPAHKSTQPDEKAPASQPTQATAENIPDDASSTEPTPVPVVQPVALRWKRNVMPPPLLGSLISLERQNDRAEAEGLERIEDEEDLSDRIARKFLVPVPVSAALTVNEDLPEHHRYCRPWTARFLADLARAHAAVFHAPLEVSSAVRTVEYQKHLMAVNGNAAAAEGDIVSPHLTGATIDIAKKWMSRQEIGWMRYWLLPLQAAGKIDVEEEFQQACFHITVYKSYVPPRPPTSISRTSVTRTSITRTRPGQPIAATRPASARQKPVQPRSRPSDDIAQGGAAAMGR